MSLPTIAMNPDRRYRRVDTQFAVCYETIPYIANRIHQLVSWARSITAVRRYLDRETAPGGMHIVAGCPFSDAETRETEDHRSFVFRLDTNSYLDDIGGYGKPGEHDYQFHLAPTGDEKTPPTSTEQFLWNAYHAGGDVRRHVRYVLLSGGLGLPRTEDRITVINYGPGGVGEETTWSFDSFSYWKAWTARGERVDNDSTRPVCQELVLESEFRVTCQVPLTGEGDCPDIDQHSPHVALTWKGLTL